MMKQELVQIIAARDAVQAQQILTSQLVELDERMVSDVLRDARQAYKETQNRVFLHAGRYIWEQSGYKDLDNAFIQNAAGWILYDLCFKHTKSMNEKLLYCQLVIARTKQETYSPYEHFIWKIIDELSKEQADTREKMLFYLNQLKPELLSLTPYTPPEGRPIASKKEKWYAMQSKIRYEMKSYETCINASRAMLSDIPTFHHDNDTWAKRRIALSLKELGYMDKAKQELEAILIRFDNSTIYADLMQIAYEQGDIELAKAYGANAILNKSGEMKHKVRVLQKMAEMYEQQDAQLAYSHYILLQSVRERENWGTKPEIVEKIKSYAAQNIQVLEQRHLKTVWDKTAKSIYPQGQGMIKNYIANGEAGFIAGEDGQDVFFSKRNNRQLKKDLEVGTSVRYYVKPTFDRRRNRQATEAVYMTVV